MGANDGDHLKVRYSSLEAAASAITTEANQLRADLDAVQAKIRSALEVWAGDAQEAYDTVQRAWDAKANDLQNRLIVIANEVRNSSDHYSGTDRRAAKFFQQ
ncbi:MULTISPECIES: WXG100 family type VII secretion target [Streptomyces]|uniref:ESAT-6-like protein n=1 Tax=Streptomyces cacaoi TaxID=1898 RepID=A0A4Y3R8E4_STRCI|nr:MULTISPECIES: WXG100 family type VII secretion target [Streptomyces]NNG86662.1 WXG100 family type VII secretion target [Streptomyces cacaoi]GEB53902.1 6 kDa early secretory antigenic target [Streptomyces cacaoi]